VELLTGALEQVLVGPQVLIMLSTWMLKTRVSSQGQAFIAQTYTDTKFPPHFAAANVIKHLYKWF